MNSPEAEWPSTSNGPFWTRLRRKLFGLSAAEIATRCSMAAEMRANIAREMAIEDADDELRFIQNYSDDQVDALKQEMAQLPDNATRLARLRELFDEDACRIAPLFER